MFDPNRKTDLQSTQQKSDSKDDNTDKLFCEVCNELIQNEELGCINPECEKNKKTDDTPSVEAKDEISSVETTDEDETHVETKTDDTKTETEVSEPTQETTETQTCEFCESVLEQDPDSVEDSLICLNTDCELNTDDDTEEDEESSDDNTEENVPENPPGPTNRIPGQYKKNNKKKKNNNNDGQRPNSNPVGIGNNSAGG